MIWSHDWLTHQLQQLDHRADLVYAEVVEERNQEEMARYADSGPESD